MFWPTNGGNIFTVTLWRTVSTLDETDKKYPSCGGVMDFDPAMGGLLCPPTVNIGKQFMVNGQTGKISGKSPISAVRVTIAVVAAIIAAAVVVWMYQYT